jgi:nicotinamide riboside kinase
VQADFVRTLVIGNSGSGKSWIAERMARNLQVQSIDLDTIHWEPGGYKTAREKGEAREIVRRAAADARWVIEGVYGWLAQEAVDRASALIWLDIDPEHCIDNLKARGLRGSSQESFDAMLIWAGEYRTRQSSSSHAGHSAIFSAFAGHAVRLRSRSEITDFLAAAFTD